MSDFAQVVKYLDIQLASRATVPLDLPNRLRGEPPNSRLGRCIKKINVTFTSEPYDPNPDEADHSQWHVAFQYNYTLPGDFIITNYLDIRNNFFSYNGRGIAIRYRIGETAYRYFLSLENKSNGNIAQNYHLQYNGELIKKNFVIELWTRAISNALNETLNVTTGILINPTNTDESVVNYESLMLLKEADLYVAFPEAFPTPFNPNVQWLDNV